MGRRRRVHLDTFVIISVVIGDKHFMDMHLALHDFARQGYEIVVTHVAVGEALAVILKKYQDPTEIDDRIRKMIRMFRKYHISVEDCIVPIRDGSHAIAVRLHDLDDRIAGNDLAIAAQALADPDSAVLLTMDSVLLYSDAIRECEDELRGGGDCRNQRMVVLHSFP